jgi:hypothetical protein
MNERRMREREMLVTVYFGYRMTCNYRAKERTQQSKKRNTTTKHEEGMGVYVWRKQGKEAEGAGEVFHHIFFLGGGGISSRSVRVCVSSIDGCCVEMDILIIFFLDTSIIIAICVCVCGLERETRS